MHHQATDQHHGGETQDKHLVLLKVKQRQGRRPEAAREPRKDGRRFTGIYYLLGSGFGFLCFWFLWNVEIYNCCALKQPSPNSWLSVCQLRPTHRLHPENIWEKSGLAYKLHLKGEDPRDVKSWQKQCLQKNKQQELRSWCNLVPKGPRHRKEAADVQETRREQERLGRTDRHRPDRQTRAGLPFLHTSPQGSPWMQIP